MQIIFGDTTCCPKCNHKVMSILNMTDHVAHKEGGGTILTVVSYKRCESALCSHKWKEVISKTTGIDLTDPADRLTSPSRFNT